jgi:hypothetical protein
VIRGFPNGETLQDELLESRTEYIGARRRTEGTETSQYLQEEKKTLIPSVAASERGKA